MRASPVPYTPLHLVPFGRYMQLSARNKAETCIRYEWYALQRWDANYSDDFSQPKIVWIELTDESKFALSTDGLIPLNTVFFMVGKHIKYLLAVINSSLIHWYFQHTFVNLTHFCIINYQV